MSVGFLIKEGFSGLKRAKYPSFAAILTIAISLTLLGISYLVGMQMYSLLNSMRAQVKIEVFLLPSATDSDRARLEKALDQYEGVASYQFITKEEAAQRFKKEFGEDIYQVLGTNPLPVSYTVEMAPGYKSSSAITQFVQTMRRYNGVDEIRYRQTLLDLIEKYYKGAVAAGVILLAIILTAAILLVANTIKLSIFAKREIIRIMQLVGATDMFIKMPFIVEGLVQGLLGAGVALLFISGIITGTNYLFIGIVKTDIRMGYSMMMGIIIAGMIFGLTGSARSIRRFLSTETR